MKRMMWRGRILLVVAGLALVGGLAFAYVLSTGHLNAWQRATVAFADGTEVTLARQHSHPILAEYRLRWSVAAPGCSPIRIAMYDSGGGFPMEVRLHRDERRGYVALGGSVFDLATGHRAFHIDGKRDNVASDDPRLPPLVGSFIIDKHMAVSPIVASRTPVR